MEAPRHSLFQPAAFRHGVLSDSLDDSRATAARPTRAFPSPPLQPLQEPPLAASPLAQPSAVPAASSWGAFPQVPYYAPARALQLRVELNDSRDVAGLQSLLHRTALRHGALYAFGSVLKSAAPAAGAATVLDRVGYVTALHDGFARMCALRERCCRHSPPRSTHHALYVRISGDAQLKDVVVLLAVEDGRLCFCICASSRATQQHLSQRALAAGVRLVWLLGAALIVEPATLDAAALSPVVGAWDAFVNLDLRANADVSVFASFPLAGATCHTPALRLVEMHNQSDAEKEPQGNAGTSFLRALWTLVGPPPRLVLPQLLAGLVRALVERSGAAAFEVRLLFDVCDGAPAAAAAAEAAGARGVVFVGAARDGAVVRSGPTSAASPLAFSRLSAAHWLSDEDRRRGGLVAADGRGEDNAAEEEEDPMDCEFALDALRYARQTGAGAEERREEGHGSQRDGGDEGEAGDESDEDEDLFEPKRWGECFQVRLHVERLIDGDDTE